MNKNSFKSLFLPSTVCCLLAIAFTGCATTKSDIPLEVQGLKNRLSVLQAESIAKDDQISQLQQIISDNEKEKASLNTQISMLNGKSKPISLVGSIKQIQLALKNAGYDAGNADGKMGNKTKKAIKDFQKDNQLTVTGKVDKDTWLKLRGFLMGKLK